MEKINIEPNIIVKNNDGSYNYRETLRLFSNTHAKNENESLRVLSEAISQLLTEPPSEIYVEVENDDIDDVDVADFKNDFLESIRRGKIGYLRLFYDRDRLSTLNKQNRQIVCECLIQHANEIKAEPNSCWVEYSLSGDIK